MAKFLPDHDQYLEQVDYGDPITADGLDDLIYKIVVHTGLNYESCKILVKYYFQEIRNGMLRGDIIYLNNIGRLYIRCAKNGTGKGKNIVPVIKPFKKFNKKIKYDD
jgi:hypothetical protein